MHVENHEPKLGGVNGVPCCSSYCSQYSMPRFPPNKGSPIWFALHKTKHKYIRVCIQMCTSMCACKREHLCVHTNVYIYRPLLISC